MRASTAGSSSARPSRSTPSRCSCRRARLADPPRWSRRRRSSTGSPRSSISTPRRSRGSRRSARCDRCRPASRSASSSSTFEGGGCRSVHSGDSWTGSSATKRPSGPGTHPVWGLDDLLFVFCPSGGTRTVHFVDFRETDGKQISKVLSWRTQSTDYAARPCSPQRLADLAWPEDGAGTTPGAIAGAACSPSVTARASERRGPRRRMAEVAKDVRDEVLALHEVETDDGPIRRLFNDVREQLLARPHARAVRRHVRPDDGLRAAHRPHRAPRGVRGRRVTAILKFDNPFLDAVYARFREQTGEVFDVDELGLRDLAEELGRRTSTNCWPTSAPQPARRPGRLLLRGFLAQYDPEQRDRPRRLLHADAGRPLHRASRRRRAQGRFGLPLGVADPTTWARLASAVPDYRDSRGRRSRGAVRLDVRPGDRHRHLPRRVDPARAGERARGRAQRRPQASRGRGRWTHGSRDVVIPAERVRDQPRLVRGRTSQGLAPASAATCVARIRLPIYLADTLAPPLQRGSLREIRGSP